MGLDVIEKVEGEYPSREGHIDSSKRKAQIRPPSHQIFTYKLELALIDRRCHTSRFLRGHQSSLYFLIRETAQNGAQLGRWIILER